MTEYRFSYNPFTKDFIECSSSHSIALYNQGKQKQFDEYIRGIIVEDTLYLRTYYPFDNLDELTLTDLHQKSKLLLKEYESELLRILKAKIINIKVVKYNVENDLLSGVGLANI